MASRCLVESNFCGGDNTHSDGLHAENRLDGFVPKPPTRNALTNMHQHSGGSKVVAMLSERKFDLTSLELRDNIETKRTAFAGKRCRPSWVR